jgi:hypothetical protein
MPPAVTTWLEEMMRTARETYGVNPVIFLIIYLGCAPIWYFSLFRTLRAAAQRRTAELLPWSMIFLAATVAPFVYVILFGRNLPWWVYGVIAVLVVQSLWSVYSRLRPRE